MTNDFETGIIKAAKLIKTSNYIVALTGAGISTPSGIPDFRSSHTGLWEKNDPLNVASLSAFLYRPTVFFNWLRPLVKEIYSANYNAAHASLTHLENNNKLVAIVTQNIDDLHQKSGSKNVIQVHGSVSKLECVKCKIFYELDELLLNNFIEKFEIPICNNCQSFLKPSITLFEEMLPNEAWTSATNHFEKADLVIVIGSSLEVYPANQLPSIAISHGAKLIINTFSSTPLDRKADILLPYDVIQVWPKILEILESS